jgi:hypothetical protein
MKRVAHGRNKSVYHEFSMIYNNGKWMRLMMDMTIFKLENSISVFVYKHVY